MEKEIHGYLYEGPNKTGWGIMNHEGEIHALKPGDVIRLGSIGGKPIFAVLHKDPIFGELSWCVSSAPPDPKPGWFVTHQET